MTEQVENAVVDMAKAFEEFKSTNDERLKQIEEKGSADPLVEEKLQKIEADLDKIEDINQQVTQQAEFQKGVNDRLDSFEKLLKRPEMGAEEGKAVDNKLEIFETWLRKGDDLSLIHISEPTRPY